jgi:hypothetical protein
VKNPADPNSPSSSKVWCRIVSRCAAASCKIAVSVLTKENQFLGIEQLSDDVRMEDALPWLFF